MLSASLRHERATRTGHAMLAHLRTEAYPVYSGRIYGDGGVPGSLERSFEDNNRRTEASKSRLSASHPIRSK